MRKDAHLVPREGWRRAGIKEVSPEDVKLGMV
jgi:hypothetical protein